MWSSPWLIPSTCLWRGIGVDEQFGCFQRIVADLDEQVLTVSFIVFAKVVLCAGEFLPAEDSVVLEMVLTASGRIVVGEIKNYGSIATDTADICATVFKSTWVIIGSCKHHKVALEYHCRSSGE